MVRKLKKSNGSNSQLDIINKAKQMQEEMLLVQDKLKDEIIEHSVAGGSVKVKVNGQKQLLDINIDLEILKDAVNDGDSKNLTDLLVPAIQEAMKKAEDLAESKMEKITGGISIPGLF